jgi:hypothetical protein
MEFRRVCKDDISHREDIKNGFRSSFLRIYEVVGKPSFHVTSVEFVDQENHDKKIMAFHVTIRTSKMESHFGIVDPRIKSCQVPKIWGSIVSFQDSREMIDTFWQFHAKQKREYMIEIIDPRIRIVEKFDSWRNGDHVEKIPTISVQRRSPNSCSKVSILGDKFSILRSIKRD